MIVDENPGKSNASNAYNRLLCEALERQGAVVREYSLKQLITGTAPDVLHVHFPEFIFSFEDLRRMNKEATKLFAGVRIARLRGARVVWTAHNAKPHECPHPERARELLAKWHLSIDGVIFLSEASRQEIQSTYPAVASLPSAVIPHGHYLDVLEGNFDRLSARKAAGLPHDGLLVAAIGAVRRYKCLPDLVERFLAVSSPDERLLIAGAYGEEALRREIEAAAASSGRVVFRFGLLSDREMEMYHTAADLLAAPYSGILNSGSAFFALSCSRPFLAPKMGSLPEIGAVVGSQWVQTYEGAFSNEVLRRAMDSARSVGNEQPDLSAFDWNEIGRATLAFFEGLRRKRSGPANLATFPE